MIDFSIEEQASRIYNSKTKEYFEEVRISYSVGNYRSCVVMLYSVVICDLVYKLQDLRDIYNDDRAKKILDEMAVLQVEKPNSPEWESKLIQRVSASTELLDGHDKTNVEYLQKHRHLSAHPVLTEDNFLFQPNKEIARSHIRNMLEGILTKTPILSARITSTILEDVAKNKNSLLMRDDLKRFLEARYLKHLSGNALVRVFKNFWKLVFISQDEECAENRFINTQTLDCIYDKNPQVILDSIRTDSAYFSNVNTDNKEQILYLFDFLQHNPQIYGYLNDGARVLLESKAKTQSDIFVKSWFMDRDPKHHFQNVIERIRNNHEISERTLIRYSEYLEQNNMDQENIEMIMLLYANIRNYSSADRIYAWFISPALESNQFKDIQLLELLKISNENSQIYDRRAARESIKPIYDAIQKNGAAINVQDYPNILQYFLA